MLLIFMIMDITETSHNCDYDHINGIDNNNNKSKYFDDNVNGNDDDGNNDNNKCT